MSPNESKSRGCLILAVILLTGALMLFASRNGGQPLVNVAVPPTPTPSVRTVEYRVPGRYYADVTLTNKNGDTEQHAGVSLPYSFAFGVTGHPFVYIAAQDAGGNGQITCQIWLDGVKMKEVTSTGDYVIASCSGTVP